MAYIFDKYTPLLIIPWDAYDDSSLIDYQLGTSRWLLDANTCKTDIE